MPMINRIEVSNFMNVDRNEEWTPTWPHAIFELCGQNSVINLPNGKGKTTIISTVLAIVAGNNKKIAEIRSIHFAPKKTGHYTHIRIQVIIDTDQGSAIDLFSGLPQGEQMVFGVYGRSGESESYTLYAYQGTFEDCPVHLNRSTEKIGRLALVSDGDFTERLQGMSNKFPASAREKTREAWRNYMSKWFDMVSIEQQLNYQQNAGGEGSSTYFEVKPRANMLYSAAVFYEHLAPQLLTNVMGDYGEEDERGIEDTIHEKARKVVHAKIQSEQRRKQLEQTERVLNEMSRLGADATLISQSEAELREASAAFATEIAALHTIVIDKPIPGIPRKPSTDVPNVANYLVLHDGEPLLPDRAFEIFTGEEAKVTNQRAARNDIKPEEVQKTQLIEIACDHGELHTSRKQGGGPSSKFYNYDAAISLLSATENFLPEWDKTIALQAVEKAFEWAKAEADTNPARLLRRRIQGELKNLVSEQTSLLDRLSELIRESVDLREEQKYVGENLAEYQRMSNSGLFSEAELAEPQKTGEAAANALNEAKKARDEHLKAVSRHENIFKQWQKFIDEYGHDSDPGQVLLSVEQAKDEAKKEVDRLGKQITVKASERQNLHVTISAARETFQLLDKRYNQALKTKPSLDRFRELFPDVKSPEGLDSVVVKDRDQARKEKTSKEKQLTQLADSLEDLNEFRRRMGADRDPAAWIKQRAHGRDRLIVKIKEIEDERSNEQITLENLNKFAIAPNQFIRKALTFISLPFVPLFQFIEDLGLAVDRKKDVLTLFSSLLHAPVLPDADQAAVAAHDLAEKQYDLPVFIGENLSRFCCSGEITLNGPDMAQNLFVGVSTMAVKCLLDPSLLEQQKEQKHLSVQRSDRRLKLLAKAQKRLSPETQLANLAARAQNAIDKNVEQLSAEMALQVKAIDEQLVVLESRASDDALAAIRGAQQHLRALNGESFDRLAECRGASEAELKQLDEKENAFETDLSSLQGNLSKANTIHGNLKEKFGRLEPIITQIQDFLADTEHGPAFMVSSEDRLRQLEDAASKADLKCQYRFELAQAFVSAGENRHIEIEQRLTTVRDEQQKLDEQKDVLNKKIETLRENSNTHTTDILRIDSVARKLIKLFKKHGREDKSEAIPTDRHNIVTTVSYIWESYRENPESANTIRRIGKLDDDIESWEDKFSEDKQNVERKQNAVNSSRESFDKELSRIVGDTSLVISEHVRILLRQSASDPQQIHALLDVMRTEYEKDRVANQTAKQLLENEWEGMSGWLSEFTRRLPIHLKLMKKVFAPQRDALTRAVTHAGFEIGGEAADIDDIKAIMGDIIKDVEDFETHQSRSTQDAKKEYWKDFRKDIKSKFYQRIIPSPHIKVCIPSISEKALMMEKKMVSSGQGVAMTLLWIVKLADFVADRERQRKTIGGSQYASSAYIKRARSMDTQFVFIDGAFSHLSDKSLIEDALKGISKTNGRFQLIVTGHDPDYNFKHNYTYFPTLITGRMISNGRFMYVENEKPIEPIEAGSNYGAMHLMSVHKIEETRDKLSPPEEYMS